MAESGKTSGVLSSAAPTTPNHTITVDKQRSLFDSIDPNAVNATNNNGNAATKADKNKTTDMKVEGVKPLTALVPILGVLGLTIGLVLWHTNHTAAIIVGLIGLAILTLWLIARRAKKTAETSKGKKKPANQTSRDSRSSSGSRRRPFSWRRRQSNQPYGTRGVRNGHEGHSGPHSNDSRSRPSWWRRGKHNSLNRDRKRSRRDSGTDAHGRSRNGWSSHTGDNDSQRRRRSWWPGRRNRDRSRSRNPRDSHSDGPGHRSRSRGTHGSNSGRSRRHPFGGGRSRHRSSSGGTPHGSGPQGGNGSHGGNHSGSSGRNRERRWYKPWTRRNRNHGGSSHGRNGNPNGTDGHGNPSADNRGDTRRGGVKNGFRKLWKWQLYDPTEENVNGYHDPNRRNRFRDRWNARRTRKQREDVNYAGFAVGPDGNARPHYSRWHDWRNQARGRNWYTFGPEDPNRATATRMDQTPTPNQTSLAIGGHSLSLGSDNSTSAQSFTQSAAPAPETVPVASNRGGRAMSSSSNPVTHAVGGRLESATHASGAMNSYRSSMWQNMVANKLRAWAARLAQSDNPYHRASANTYAIMAARAAEAAQSDARLAAIQMSEAQNAIGNGGQRSIGS